MSELYDKSIFAIYSSYVVQTVFFGINIYLILNPQTGSGYIWTILGITIIVVLFNFYLMVRSKKFYELAESVRKLNMIQLIFPEARNSTERALTLARIPENILNNGKGDGKLESSYYTKEEGKYEKLISHIQENSFFTSQLSKSYSNIIMLVIVFFLLSYGLSIIFGFFKVSQTVGLEQQGFVAGYLALFVNFIFALNIFSHYQIYLNNSKNLESIDRNLGINTKLSEDEVINAFSEYNCILSTGLPVPKFVYSMHRNKLNTIWAQRVDSL